MHCNAGFRVILDKNVSRTADSFCGQGSRWTMVGDMAIRNIVESDISGEPDAATITFGLGDTWYEVDLTEEERKKLEQAFAEYVKVGRKATKRATSNRVVPDTTPEERDEIRLWARDNGFELADFGKIPNKIYYAYREAHEKS